MLKFLKNFESAFSCLRHFTANNFEEYCLEIKNVDIKFKSVLVSK